MGTRPAQRNPQVLGARSPNDAKRLEKPKRIDGRDVAEFSRILVGIDFSVDSEGALEYALAVARFFSAELICIHVVEAPYGAEEVGFIGKAGSVRAKAKEVSTRRLESVLRAHRYEKLKQRVAFGTPYHEILKEAQRKSADLIVVAGQGRTGLPRVLLGSTSERIVRHAECPVLVFRGKPREHTEPKDRQRTKKNLPV